MKSGKKAGGLYFVATLFNKGIAFLTIPFFSRLLSTTDFGIVTTYLSWVDILTVVFSLALYLSIRIAFLDYQGNEVSYLNTVISFTVAFGLGGGVLTVGVAQVFFDVDITLLTLAIIQGIASAMLMDYMQYLMMKFEYVKRTLYMVLPNFFSVIFALVVIIFFSSGCKYMDRILPMVFVYIIFSVLIAISVYRHGRPKISMLHLKYGLTFSLPLVLHGIALNVLSQSDRTMITWLVGADKTGIYSLVYSFGMIATVITTALEGIWVPWFYKKLQENKLDEINIRAIDYNKLMAYAMVALILGGPEVYKLMADKPYWEGVNIIPPIVLANYVIFMYTLYVNIEHYHKKTMAITFNTAIAALCNIILNLVFVPVYGYVAAAYTTLVSYVIAFILHAFYSKKIKPKTLPIRIFVKPLVMLLITIFIYYVLLDKVLLRWGCLFFMLITAAIKERKSVMYYLVNTNQ